MGNEHEEPPEDEFCRDNKRHELIPVEIEGLPARAFKVPLNELRRLGQDAELEQVDTLLAEEIKSSADVEANPLALALLGVAEKVSGNGANLLKMVAQAPASLLAQWTEKTGTLGELKNVQIRDLKELFFEYLQKNGVVANEKVDRDQFVEMQVKQGLADILLKESCNEKDLVRFLNERSHRGLDRELLMEGFEQFTRIGQEEELSDRKQLKVVYEDLRTLVNLSKVGKFDVPFDVIKKVLVAFEKVANPIFEIYRMENEGHSYEKNPEIFDEFIEKSVIDIVKQEKRENAPADTEIIFADEERAPGLKVKTEDFEELIVVRKVIDSPLNKELTVPPEEEKSDEEPEEHKKLEFWEDEQITPEMCEMDNEIPRAEEFNLELERRKRVNRTGISKSMLEDIFSQGVFWGVRIPHQQKIFNALEMQKLARDTSNSRMKQYLLMYKVAETPLEQEFCLQRMRKELVSYGNFSADVLAKSDRFSHFELFVDALARQMEAQVGSGENAKMGKVVAQILDRKFVAKSSRLAFKEFLEERVGEKNGREEAEWSENVKESDNLKLSTAKLAELAKGVNIGGFLEKLELAVTGNWENKELIQLRKDLFKLAASRPNTSELSLAKVKTILTEAERESEYREVEKKVEQGKTVLQALKESAKMGAELEQLKETQSERFYQLNEAQFYQIALSKIGQLTEKSVANLRENLRNRELPTRPSLMNLYYPQFSQKATGQVHQIENDQSETENQRNEAKRLLSKIGANEVEFKDEKGESRPVWKFWLGHAQLAKATNEVERGFEAILKKKHKLAKAKDFLWELGTHFFEPDKIASIGAKEGERTTKKVIIRELLKFFTEQNITELSTKFEKDLLGMRTSNKNLKNHLTATYNTIIQISAKKSLSMSDDDENVTTHKDYRLIQRGLTELVQSYAKNRTTSDCAELTRDRENTVHVQELMVDDDEAVLADLQRLLEQGPDSELNEGELVPFGDETGRDALEQGLLDLVGQFSGSVGDGKEVSNKVKEEVLNLHGMNRDLMVFQKRLKHEHLVEENPVVKAYIGQILQDNLSWREAHLLTDNKLNLAMIESIRAILDKETNSLLANLNKLYRLKRGLMTSQEEAELLKSVEGTIQSELLEMYQTPLNPLNPGNDQLQRESSVENDPEVAELEQILDGKPGPMRTKAHVLDSVLRPDIHLRPRIIVENRRKYLSELEQWKQEMLAKGLEQMMPGLDLEVSVVERPKPEGGMRSTVFNLPDFFEQDDWQIAEMTGIIGGKGNLQLRVDKLDKRSRFEQVLLEELQELIMGNDLNLYASLYYLYCQTRTLESGQKSKSEKRRLVEAKEDESDLEMERQESTKFVLRGLVRRSLDRLGLAPNDASSDVVGRVEQKVDEMISLYVQILDVYLKDQKIWGKQKMGKLEKIQEIIESFEEEIGLRNEGEYLSKFIRQMQKHLNKEEKSNTKKTDSIDSQTNSTQIDHFSLIRELLDSRFSIQKDSLKMIEYHVDSGTLDDQEKIRSHFEDVFCKNAQTERVPSLTKRADQERKFSRQVAPNLQVENQESIMSHVEFRREVLLQKLDHMKKEQFWLSRYTTSKERKTGPNNSVKNKFIPQEEYNSPLMAQIYDGQPEIIEPDAYQEILRDKGFMDERAPDEEDKSGPEKSWVKNSEVVADALMARMRFHRDEECLVLQEVQKARMGEDNLLAEAIQYISESTRVRHDRKNTFWENNIGAFDAVEAYEDEVDVFHDRQLDKKDWTVSNERKTMTLQEVYSGIILKRRLKNYLVEAFREKAEEKKAIENKSDVQADFMKFVLDNFHGSGIQKYMLTQWLREVPDFEGFYENLAENYKEQSMSRAAEWAYEKAEPMTKEELDNYNHEEEVEILEEIAGPSNAINRDVIGKQVQQMVKRDLEIMEMDYLEKKEDEMVQKIEKFTEDYDKMAEEVMQYQKEHEMDHFDYDNEVEKIMQKYPYELEFEVEEQKDIFDKKYIDRARLAKTEASKLRHKAADYAKMMSGDEQAMLLEPWEPLTSELGKITEEQMEQMRDLDERTEALENMNQELSDEEMNFEFFEEGDFPAFDEMERQLKEDGKLSYKELTREEMLEKELEALETYKHDLVFYVSNCVADHKERLQSKIDKEGGPFGLGQKENIEKILNNRRDQMVATFYDNRALEEFNTLRKLRQIAQKTKKFKYDDVSRSIDRKGRDKFLERTKPELILDEVGGNSYQIRHPDDGTSTYENQQNPPGKDVYSVKSKQMRDLEKATVLEHELQERIFDSDGEEMNSDDEFFDRYLFDYRVHKQKKADMTDLDQLRPLVFRDLYSEKPEAAFLDPMTTERARSWFLEKYEFILDPEQLSEIESVELGIIAYLFSLNRQRKLTLGDIYLEMSRRRLNLDPRKFKGVGIHHIQQYRVKLRESFARKEYSRDLKGSQNEYLDLFPPDKLTDYELLSDTDYFKMIETLTKLRVRENPKFIFEDESYGEILENDPVHGPSQTREIEHTILTLGGPNAENLEFPDEPMFQPPSIAENLDQDLPPVCLELELFNLIDLYFAMYGKDKRLPKEKRPATKETVTHILSRSRPVLKLDEEVKSAFNSSLEIVEDPVTGKHLLPFDEIARHVQIDERMIQMATNMTGQEDLESLAESLVEEIIRVCPHVYPETFGDDPGKIDSDWSIQNQILRRFDDSVASESPTRMWRRAVDLEFNFDDRNLPLEEEIQDSVHRPDYLKKADYDDAKEVLRRRRATKMFNEMREDPFFEEKMEEYFASCHQMKVRNLYQRQFDFLEKPQEVLDRKTSPLVKNELMDFLVRYSDLRMQTRDRFYSSYAGREVKERQLMQQKKGELFNSPHMLDYLEEKDPAEKAGLVMSIRRIRDFETRFFETARDSLAPNEPMFTKFVTTSAGGDLLDLETRLNRLRDKQEFAGMHGTYKEHNLFTTTIPFALPLLDIRRPAEEWMLAQIDLFLDEIMNTRLNLERYMTKDELQKFDLELRRLLTRENLRDAVLKQLDQELTLAEVVRRNYLKPQDYGAQLFEELSQWENLQSTFKKSVKNHQAVKLLYAHDSARALRRPLEDTKEDLKDMEEHLDTSQMLMEEAMGADYEYLTWQSKRRDFYQKGSDEYMENEGYRSKRYINNEVMAKYYGKTVFEEYTKNDVYHGMGLTSWGSQGVFANPQVSEEMKTYQGSQQLGTGSMKRSKILENIVSGLSDSGHENQVSKSLGWYFKKINLELQDRK